MLLIDKIKKAFFEEEEEANEVEASDLSDEFIESDESDPNKSIVFSKKKTEHEEKLERVESVIDLNDETQEIIMKNAEKKAEEKEKAESVKVEKPKAEIPKSKYNILADSVSSTGKQNDAKPSRTLERKEIEIPEVVSPIYGVKEDIEERNSESQYVRQPKVKRERRNPLGTVISPFYGLQELDEFEEEAQRDIVIDKYDDDNSSDVDYINDEEIENVSINDIVSNNDKTDDEMIQFSLFGQDRVIKEDEYTQDIELTENDEDDDLPF